MAKKEAKTPAVVADARTGLQPTVDVQHAWYEIRRGPAWKSMALVAVDDGPPPAVLAQSFGYLATEEKTRRILVVNASTQQSFSDAAKAPEIETYRRDLAPGDRSAVTALDDHVDYMQLSRFDRVSAARFLVSPPHTFEALTSGSPGYDGVIFAIDSPIVYPQATQLARAVDIVVLCIRLGATSLDAARRVTEIIGAEKIVGSIAFRPGGKSA